MKLLNIKDNSQQKKGTFSHIENLTGKIADKTLEQLEHEGVFVFPEIIRDSEDIITKDQMILQSVNVYFGEYLALQKLCLLILQHRKHQVGSWSKQIYGILFDGAWLWEEYINSLIEDIFYHPMNKAHKGAQWLFDGNVGLIYPDFISRNSKTRMIADAKYKPIDNIGNRDYLQALAYMFRFDAKTGYYFYPEVGNHDALRLCMNRGSTYESNVSPRDNISIIKHGLKIPVDAPDYAVFVTRMANAEQDFMKVFSM